MKLKLKTLVLSLLLISSLAFSVEGCKNHTVNLEKGGAYAQTNQPTQQELFIADEAYKLAYTTVQGVFKFEKDNRAMIKSISPEIKKDLDKARPIAVDIDKRWANARFLYKQAPTPQGLSTIQGILQEAQVLIPIVQEAIAPVYSNLVKK